mgnify:FL=1
MQMAKKLTKKEKGFADAILEGKEKRHAIRENYNLGSKGGSKTEDQLINTADSMGQETFNKPKVQQYIENNSYDAVTRIVKISKMTKENPAVALSANKDIVDRAGFKPVEKSESKSIRVNLEAKIENKEIEALR